MEVIEAPTMRTHIAKRLTHKKLEEGEQALKQDILRQGSNQTN